MPNPKIRFGFTFKIKVIQTRRFFGRGGCIVKKRYEATTQSSKEKKKIVLPLPQQKKHRLHDATFYLRAWLLLFIVTYIVKAYRKGIVVVHYIKKGLL